MNEDRPPAYTRPRRAQAVADEIEGVSRSYVSGVLQVAEKDKALTQAEAVRTVQGALVARKARLKEDAS